MQTYNETAETCPNCQGLLRYFANGDRIDSYCPQILCTYSSNYTDQYFIPYNYFKENGKNIGSFHFVDSSGAGGNATVQSVNIVEQKTVKTYYTLSLENIIGFEDVKDLLRKSVNTINPVHILLCSPPSVSKTYMLTSMLSELKSSGGITQFIDCSSASPSGIAELLSNNPNVEYCVFDEIDSMRKIDQKFLLLMLQNGKLRITKSRKIIEIDLSKTKFYFTCNNLNRLIDPLLSRLVVINLPNYSETEFYNVGLKVLENKYGINNDMGYYLVDQIYTLFKPNSYIRDVEKVAKLLGNNISYPNIDKVIRTMEKYRIR